MWGKQVIRCIFLLFLQFFIIHKLEFFDLCHPFLYILFLLLFPVRRTIIEDMLLGGAIGLIVDVFYNSLGVHFAVCVLIMFIRRRLIQGKFVDFERIDDDIISQSIGKSLFWTYSLILVLIHHSLIFIMDMGNLNHLGKTVLQLVFSYLFSAIFVLFYDYNLSKSKPVR